MKESKAPKEPKVFKRWVDGDGEGDPDHSETWKLFDMFPTSSSPFLCDASSLGSINKTYPPRYVYLSDHWVGRVVESDLVAGSRQDRWPGDFKHKGHIQSSRQPKGSAYYVKDAHNNLCYAIAGGCYQLHGFEGVLQGLRVTKRENPMPLPNAGKKMKIGDLVINPGTKVTRVSTPVPTSVPTSVPTQISAPIPTPTPNQTPNLKRRIIEDEDSNPEISVKKARTEGKEENDIDIIPMLLSEDEKEPEPKSRELEDTRLVCEFLYETARNQGKILVGLGQQYKGLMGAKEYAILKEKCKEISESTSSMIRCFLSSYPDGRKMFKAAKDPKVIGSDKVIGSG
jgi:hypothetical protein